MAYCESCEYHEDPMNASIPGWIHVPKYKPIFMLSDELFVGSIEGALYLFKYGPSVNFDVEVEYQKKLGELGYAPEVYSYWRCAENSKIGKNMIVSYFSHDYSLDGILTGLYEEKLTTELLNYLINAIVNLNNAGLYLNIIKFGEILYKRGVESPSFLFANLSMISTYGDDIRILSDKLLEDPRVSPDVKQYILGFRVNELQLESQPVPNYTSNKSTTKMCSLTDETISQCYKNNLDTTECLNIDKMMKDILNDTYAKAVKAGKPPKEYQKLAVQHMLNNTGLIVAFQVGTGKTLTAVMAINAVNKLAEVMCRPLRTIIITPASLVDNIKNEMKRYGMNIKDDKFKFMTLSKFGLDYKKGLIDCNNTFLVIDEAHNIRTDYMASFGMIKQVNDKAIAASAVKCGSVAWKSMLLTATPFYNASHDIINLLSIVKKRDIPYNSVEWDTIILNDEYFREEFECTTIFQDSNPNDFPKRLNKYIRLEMTDEYYRQYKKIEDSIRVPKAKKKKRNDNGEEEKVLNSFYIILKKAGNDLNPCLKCHFVINNVLNLKQKTIVYSSLKSSGIDLISSKLNPRDYLKITGDIKQSERQTIADRFNDPNGPYVLFITKAGGEGLDLKGVRHIVILEQGWNDSSNEQAIGRGIRYKSHDHLPPEERNTTVYYLILVKPRHVVERLTEIYNKQGMSPGDEKITSADEHFLRITESKRRENEKMESRFREIDLKQGNCNSPKL